MPSKVTPPSQDGLIAREQIKSLATTLAQKKVVHVHAPAGYGKSCAVLQLCEAMQLPHAWYRLSDTDNDYRQFAAYLVAALAPYLPEQSMCQQMASSGQVKQLSAFLTQLSVELIQSTASVSSRIVLVIDDTHVLTDEKIISAFQSFLLALPDTFMVMLVGRERMPVSLGQLYMENKVHELSNEQFMFDASTAAQLIQQKFDISLSSTQSQALIDKTGGWVAGIQLMVLATKQMQGDVTQQPLTQHDEQAQGLLFHYLADEIFSQLPEHVREFLLLSSVLDHFDVELAQHVTGLAQAQSVLQNLLTQRLFIEAIGDSPVYYRYHSLFADFLRDQLASKYPDKRHALQSMAAMWWLKRGNYQLAVEYANKAKSAQVWEAILDIAGWTFYRQGACGLIQVGMMQLSLDTISNHATLSILNALTRLYGNAEEVEQQLRLAQPKLKQQLSTAEFEAYQGAIALVKAQQALSLGDSERAKQYATQSLSQLDDNYRILIPVAKSALAEAYFAQGEKDKAQSLWLEVLDEASVNQNYQLVLWAYHHLSTVDVVKNELQHAFSNQLRAIEYAESYCLDLNHGLWCIIRGRAEILCLWMQAEQAQGYVDKANSFIDEWVKDGIIDAQDEQERVPVDTLQCRVARLSKNKRVHAKYAQRLDNLLLKGGYHAYVRMQAEQELIWYWIQEKQTDKLKSWLALQPAIQSALNTVEQVHGRNVYHVAHELGQTALAEQVLKILVDDASKADLKLEAGINAIWVAHRLVGQHKKTEAIQQWLIPAILRLSSSEAYLPFVEASDLLLSCYQQLLADNTLVDARAERFVKVLLDKCMRSSTVNILPEVLSVAGVSTKEWQVLQCIMDGKSNHAIAEELFMAVGTVKNMLTKIYGKLGVKNRKQALAWLESSL